MGENLQRGCLFCRTGKELEAVKAFKHWFPEGRAIAPTRTRYRRKGETVKEERVPLLPGYVFFELHGMDLDTNGGDEIKENASSFDNGMRQVSRTDGVIKLLRYSDGQWQLHGFDDHFARVLFETEGNIDVSQAWFDAGKKIRILSGFLKDYEGAITRVNKKKKTVEIQVDLQGKKAIMWLGYELVEPLSE